ncbi:hypothetical protein AGMMS49587_18040 [Spirochaetia bacterium]|nr:hypothetical protein AGMMS49587_18040 [Spirochaetia bacterium]
MKKNVLRVLAGCDTGNSPSPGAPPPRVRFGLKLSFLITLIAALAIIGCDNGSTTPPTPKIVAVEYRGTTIDSVGTIGETTVTTTDDSVTLSGVYTQGGGIVSGLADGTWAYLYNGEGKRGIVIRLSDGSNVILWADFGPTSITNTKSVFTFSPPVNTTDMTTDPDVGLHT